MRVKQCQCIVQKGMQSKIVSVSGFGSFAKAMTRGDVPKGSQPPLGRWHRSLKAANLLKKLLRKKEPIPNRYCSMCC